MNIDRTLINLLICEKKNIIFNALECTLYGTEYMGVTFTNSRIEFNEHIKKTNKQKVSEG